MKPVDPKYCAGKKSRLGNRELARTHRDQKARKTTGSTVLLP
jgi:hypothetical protein